MFTEIWCSCVPLITLFKTKIVNTELNWFLELRKKEEVIL